MAYSDVSSQRSMAMDLRRNKAYFTALKQVVTPDSVVLDLGAGLGVHGLLAAQLGAKQVYLVEPEHVGSVAMEVARANGFGDRVKWLQGKIEEVELPEKVDIITSVFTGNFLLNEDLLPSLFYARDRWLKLGGVLIPDKAIMYAAPVYAPGLFESRIEVWDKPHLGLDYSAGRRFSANDQSPIRKIINRNSYLARPKALKSLDLNLATAADTNCSTTVNFKIDQAENCHGFFGWFTMRLGDKWISTAPHKPSMHWSAMYLPIDPLLKLQAGHFLQLKLDRPLRGPWNWRITYEDQKRNHSTFKANLNLRGQLKGLLPSIDDAFPILSQRGQIAQTILNCFDGKQSINQIAKKISKQWPNVITLKQATHMVTRLIRQHGMDKDNAQLSSTSNTTDLP